MRLGIIDLGTNSARFDVHSIGPSYEATLVHREKRMVRLGDGVFETGRFSKDAEERTLSALEEFSRIMARLKVTRVVAVATSAMRESESSKSFIRRIQLRTGIRLREISGNDEAALIAKGILAREGVPPGLFVLIDIGGGSTEVNICLGCNSLKSVSLPLGANRMRQVFCGEKAVATLRGRIQSARRLGQKVARVVKSEFGSSNRVPFAIGSSGTIRALHRILRKSGEPMDPFSVDSLERLNKKMSRLTPTQLLRVPGMDPSRLDLIVPGALILEHVCRGLGVTQVGVTEMGLREGVLQNELEVLARERWARK